MKKFNLIPVLFAVIMAMSFLTSCEKEETKVVSDNVWDVNKYITAATEQITVPIAHSNHKAVFEIGASDPTFLRAVSANDITFKWLSDAELEEANNMQQNEGEVASTPENDKIVGEKLDRNRFVSIKLTKIQDVDSESDIRPYNVAFSQNLQNYLRDNKISLSISFEDNLAYFTGSSRACSSGCYFNNYNKSIALFGDGGVVKTFVATSWSNYNSQCWTPLYDCIDNPFGNCTEAWAIREDQSFYNNGRCSVCPYNSAKWVRWIWLDYDVLSSYSALSNSCSSNNTNIGYWECFAY